MRNRESAIARRRGECANTELYPTMGLWFRTALGQVRGRRGVIMDDYGQKEGGLVLRALQTTTRDAARTFYTAGNLGVGRGPH